MRVRPLLWKKMNTTASNRFVWTNPHFFAEAVVFIFFQSTGRTRIFWKNFFFPSEKKFFWKKMNTTASIYFVWTNPHFLKNFFFPLRKIFFLKKDEYDRFKSFCVDEPAFFENFFSEPLGKSGVKKFFRRGEKKKKISKHAGSPGTLKKDEYDRFSKKMRVRPLKIFEAVVFIFFQSTGRTRIFWIFFFFTRKVRNCNRAKLVYWTNGYDFLHHWCSKISKMKSDKVLKLASQVNAEQVHSLLFILLSWNFQLWVRFSKKMRVRPPKIFDLSP